LSRWHTNLFEDIVDRSLQVGVLVKELFDASEDESDLLFLFLQLNEQVVEGHLLFIHFLFLEKLSPPVLGERLGVCDFCVLLANLLTQLLQLAIANIKLTKQKSINK